MVLALGAWLGLTGSAMAGEFTPGNLVVLLNADTTGPAGKAAGIKLLEYTTAGSLVQTITIGSVTAGNRLTQSNGTAFEGYLSRSGDGKYLTFAGYDAAAGESNVKDSATTGGLNPILRVIGKVEFSTGTVSLGTTTTSYSNDSITAATSVDGSRYWTGGASKNDHGVRTIADGGTGAATKVNEDVNVRSLQVFNNQLYGSTQSTIFQTNTALPTGTSDTTNLVTGLNNASGFFFLDMNKDGTLDTLYIATQTGDGLIKYTFNGSVWTSSETFINKKELSVNSVVAVQNGTLIDLYVTTGDGTKDKNALRKLTDDGTTFNNLDYTTLATAAEGTSFRSVQLTASVPEPTSLVLVGLVAAGGIVFRLRRRGARGVDADKTP